MLCFHFYLFQNILFPFQIFHGPIRGLEVCSLISTVCEYSSFFSIIDLSFIPLWSEVFDKILISIFLKNYYSSEEYSMCTLED